MILIALGSNMGDREANLREAVHELAAAGVRVHAQSSILETPAVLPTGAPPAWNLPYLNQVMIVETTHQPEALLGIMKSIELQLGRVERGRWGPRELDLDLLAYHKERRDTETLTLPHPQMPWRRFVLQPLQEVAPGWKHPVLEKTAGEMLAELSR